MTAFRPASLLFGAYRRDVLALLLLHPEESTHVREIARAIGKAPGTLLRELNALAAAGVLVRKPLGNQVHFQANPACPIYEDLRNILKKTVGVGDVLREALAPLAPAQETLRREVNPSVYPASEFGKKLAARDPFLGRVLAERKIFIVGGEDDLGKPAAHRKAEGARRR